MCSCLGGGLVAERACLELGENAKPVDGPLLELLECDVCCGRDNVKVQAVLVFEILIGGSGELFFAVMERCAPLCVHARDILSDHDEGVACSI